eukprot:4067656-Prorocentrum_lima.AAC.1
MVSLWSLALLLRMRGMFVLLMGLEFVFVLLLCSIVVRMAEVLPSLLKMAVLHLLRLASLPGAR